MHPVNIRYKAPNFTYESNTTIGINKSPKILFINKTLNVYFSASSGSENSIPSIFITHDLIWYTQITIIKI